MNIIKREEFETMRRKIPANCLQCFHSILRGLLLIRIRGKSSINNMFGS